MAASELLLLLICLINQTRAVDRCANNPKNSSTTTIGEHILCRYSMSTILGFDQIENKNTLYCGKIMYEKVFYFFKRTCKKYN